MAPEDEPRPDCEPELVALPPVADELLPVLPEVPDELLAPPAGLIEEELPEGLADEAPVDPVVPELPDVLPEACGWLLAPLEADPLMSLDAPEELDGELAEPPEPYAPCAEPPADPMPELEPEAEPPPEVPQAVRTNAAVRGMSHFFIQFLLDWSAL